MLFIAELLASLGDRGEWFPSVDQVLDALEEWENPKSNVRGGGAGLGGPQAVCRVVQNVFCHLAWALLASSTVVLSLATRCGFCKEGGENAFYSAKPRRDGGVPAHWR